jgi:hypothetical protein
MGRLRDESLDEICFEVECLNFFDQMRKKYKYSQLGYCFDANYQLVNKLLKKLIKQHEIEFNEKLDITLIKQL